jgi:[ribosomal protein S18]-alanine N-acetyltransferase
VESSLSGPDSIDKAISVLPLQHDDLDGIMQIEAGAFHPKDADTRATMEESARRYPAGFFVAKVAGRAVGYLMSRPRDTSGYIHSMAVTERWRRHGIGRKLLEAAVGHYMRHAFQQIELEVRPDNIAAITLYASLGFLAEAECPRFYESDGSSAIVMRKHLTLTALNDRTSDDRRAAPP